MTIVSYAQNYEDIMLLRALGDIEQGFYVDVGAQDPVVDSVTRLFYERGWRGINIEPVRHWHERLLQDRPEDVNLRLLVTDAPGTASFHEVTDSGLSTMDDALAAAHAQAGRRVVEHVLECATLDDLLARHAPPTIHFLKIDVEGSEARVLRGLSLDRYRPWVLVIEACAPNSRTETYGEWESDVLEAGYRFVYFDGLNRFYLAEEQGSRVSSFASPPNVLDDFIRQGEWRARTDLALLQVASEDKAKRIGVLGATVAEREVQLGQWRDRAAELSAHVDRLQQVSDARGAEADSLATQVTEWSARAADLSEHIERLQQLADGRLAQLTGAMQAAAAREAELADARRELAARDAQLVEAERVAVREIAARDAKLIEAERVAAREIAARDAKLIDAKAELMSARAAYSFAEVELQRRESLLALILGSRSWRLTRPLRVAARLLRNGPQELADGLLQRSGSGWMHRLVLGAMRFVPGLRRHERDAAARPDEATGERPQSPPDTKEGLSDRAGTALAAMDHARGWSASEQELD